MNMLYISIYGYITSCVYRFRIHKLALCEPTSGKYMDFAVLRLFYTFSFIEKHGINFVRLVLRR
jgi:hypothetical protein